MPNPIDLNQIAATLGSLSPSPSETPEEIIARLDREKVSLGHRLSEAAKQLDHKRQIEAKLLTHDLIRGYMTFVIVVLLAGFCLYTLFGNASQEAKDIAKQVILTVLGSVLGYGFKSNSTNKTD